LWRHILPASLPGGTIERGAPHRLDAAFLSLETPSNHMHLIAVAVLDPTSARLHCDREAADREPPDRLPPFRRRVVPCRSGSITPWIEDPGFDIDFHVRQAALPPGASAARGVRR
jgi:hypothetical protein